MSNSYPLYPIGTRVRHNFWREQKTGLGTVVDHKAPFIVVRRDDDGVTYETHPINWWPLP